MSLFLVTALNEARLAAVLPGLWRSEALVWRRVNENAIFRCVLIQRVVLDSTPDMFRIRSKLSHFELKMENNMNVYSFVFQYFAYRLYLIRFIR